MPFSVDEFLAVFARYNEAVWPMPLVWSALAVVAVLLILRRHASTDRAMSLLLALLWIWMSGVYHLGYFRAINPAAVLFGALFLAEGVAFAVEGVWRSRLRFEARRDARSLAAVAMISFALFGYPLASVLLGRAFPAVPTFGLPCPTTIFTLGVLALARPPAAWTLWIIPLAWSVLGSSAALRLGMTEDFALPAAALAAALVRWRSADRRSRPRRLEHPAGWFECIRRDAIGKWESWGSGERQAFRARRKESAMQSPVRHRAATAIRGVAALLFALPLLFWDGVDTNGLVLAFGGYALISAAAALVAAYDGRSPSLALLGGANLVAGMLFLTWPEIDQLRTVYILGAWAMMTGTLEMFAAGRIIGHPVTRWLRAGAGVAMIGLGSLLAFFPELDAATLGPLLGAAVLVFGLFLLAPAAEPGLPGGRSTRTAVSSGPAR